MRPPFPAAIPVRSGCSASGFHRDAALVDDAGGIEWIWLIIQPCPIPFNPVNRFTWDACRTSRDG